MAVISRQAVGSLFRKVLMHLSYPQTHERFILTELENLNFWEICLDIEYDFKFDSLEVCKPCLTMDSAS